jgi:hypothetical protein
MYVLLYKKKSGQLELKEGYNILEFKINPSSVFVLTETGSKKRLEYGTSNTVTIYAGHNSPIIVLGSH